MSNDDIGPRGQFAMAVASIFGLVGSAVGGLAGLVAAVWIAIALIGSGRKVGPKIGVTALHLRASDADKPAGNAL